MKKVTLKILILCFVFSGLYVTHAHAQTNQAQKSGDYVLLTPLNIEGNVTDCPKEGPCKTSFPNYVREVFRIGIIAAGILAVIVIVYAGIQYMGSEAWTSKAEAKKKILAALGGLILALSAYLLLQTINPDLIPNVQNPLNISVPTNEGEVLREKRRAMEASQNTETSGTNKPEGSYCFMTSRSSYEQYTSRSCYTSESECEAARSPSEEKLKSPCFKS